MRDVNKRLTDKPVTAKSIASRLYSLAESRPYTVILIAALAYNLLCKLYWSYRLQMPGHYYKWIFADLIVLLGIEAIFAIICNYWPKKSVIRLITFAAALICAWSVMNAGWLIRNGHQMLPHNLLPLFRDPVNGFSIIGGNFKTLPLTAFILMAPAMTLLVFFFWVFVRPKKPNYNRKRFALRIRMSFLAVVLASIAYVLIIHANPDDLTAAELRHNCQLTAVTSLLNPKRYIKDKKHNPKRIIPSIDEFNISRDPGYHQPDYNIIIVVLEGVQYRLTSLADKKSDLTPFLFELAEQGVQFPNARCILTHTTKALFSLLTGLTPSVSHDIAEAVPVEKPYVSLAAILKRNLNYRTAFFQSAKGNFECRPGLVYNLDFEKFLARDDLKDPNDYVGYLGCDEFALLQPVTEWIKQENHPFLITVMCSVSHDPYEVPDWFAEPQKELFSRYLQTIKYTDSFLAALDVELSKLNLMNNTIFCVIGDHGEAFGEHAQFGHERIVFEETLRIPFVIRAPFFIEQSTVINHPVSSIDLTPTLLGLLGFKTKDCGFDGIDALGNELKDRRIYFSGWFEQSPAGFIEENRKYLYDPTLKITAFYDLAIDPNEMFRTVLGEDRAQKIEKHITDWRNNSIFIINQQRTGQKILFDNWFCDWTDRVSDADFKNNSH